MKRTLAAGFILLLCAMPGAFAQASPLEPGLLLLGGGSGSYGWFTLATTSTTSNSYINVYGWLGYTLAGGSNIGPYVSLYWNKSSDTEYPDQNNSSSLTIYPGFQFSYYGSVGAVLLYFRANETIQLWTSSSTSSGTTTSYDLSVSGLSTEVTVGVSSPITDYLLLDVGPNLNYFMSFTSDYMHLRVGFEVELVVLL